MALFFCIKQLYKNVIYMYNAQKSQNAELKDMNW